MRAKHEAEGTELSFKCGYYELLRMVTRSLSKVNDFLDEPGKSRTLRDSVKNGILAYRPNLSTGKLERAQDQDWCKRIGATVGNKWMGADWVSVRFSWLDKNGKPKGPFREANEQSLMHDEMADRPKAPCEQRCAASG